MIECTYDTTANASDMRLQLAEQAVRTAFRLAERFLRWVFVSVGKMLCDAGLFRQPKR
jgi:hypothetical protein